MTELDATGARLGFAWSLWTELGVPGPRRDHAHAVLDPERLLLHTPWLAREDARLVDLARAWCVRNASWLYTGRLFTLVADAPPVARTAAESFLESLADEGILRQVPSRRPRGSAPLVSSEPMPLPRIVEVHPERPALLRFRIRALVGISGRAEVLLALLGRATTWTRTSELDDGGIGKRNVARILGELDDAGIVRMRPKGNALEFRLAAPDALAEVVGARPDLAWPDWDAAFAWFLAVDELAAIPVTQPATRRVQVARRRDELGRLALGLGLKPPPPDDTGAFLAWTLEGSRALTEGATSAFRGPPR